MDESLARARDALSRASGMPVQEPELHHDCAPAPPRAVGAEPSFVSRKALQIDVRLGHGVPIGCDDAIREIATFPCK